MEQVCEKCGIGPAVYVVNDCTIDTDVPDYYICEDCRYKLLSGIEEAKPVGRPKIGVTRKVSLTLSEEDWAWFDEESDGNKSQLLRNMIFDQRLPVAQWNNNACLGYVIKGAEDLGLDDDQIQKLVRAIRGTFDMTSVDEAKDIYNKSSY